jgi:hypothetical protein
MHQTLPQGVRVASLTVAQHQGFVGNNSSVAFFDLTFAMDATVDAAAAEAVIKKGGYDRICIKVMPTEGLVPGWLLKRFWKAEMFFYNRMAGGFPQPKCYFSSMVNDAGIIVMNVISDRGKGLACGDSCRDLTYPEACLSLLILAKFHAKWWNCKDKKVLSSLGHFKDMESGITCKFLMGGADHMLSIPEYAPIRNLVNCMKHKVKAVYRLLKRPPYTVTHGDSRSDNFFYTKDDRSETFDEEQYGAIVRQDSQDTMDDGRLSDAGSVQSSVTSEALSIASSLDDNSEAALCDFQMIMVSNPMRDYANFVVNSLAPADRRKWGDKLVKHYWMELIRSGVDAAEYPLEQALIDARVMMFWPLLCNISIAEKQLSHFNTLVEKEAAGTVAPEEAKKLMLIRKTRPRLISACQDAKLLDMIANESDDPNLPFIPCCCCWGC